MEKTGEIGVVLENIKNIYKKLDEHNIRMNKLEDKQDAQYKMAESIAVMAEQMKGMRENVQDVKNEVSEVKDDLSRIKSRDGANWNSFKWLVFVSVVTAVITHFLTKMGV